jgi:hypothetical protein
LGDARNGEPIRLLAGTPGGARAVAAGGAHTLALLPVLQPEEVPVDVIVPAETEEPPTDLVEEPPMDSGEETTP